MHSDPDPSKKQANDTRSPKIKAMDRVSEIIAISMCLVVPVIGGYYLDQWLGTGYVFMFLGLVFGMTAAGVQFRKLLVSLERESKR